MPGEAVVNSDILDREPNLSPDQNILDQEPFRSILTEALYKTETRFDKEEDIRFRKFILPEGISFPPVRDPQSYESGQRYKNQWAAIVFFINVAVKRPDVCSRLKEVSKEKRRMVLDEEFGLFIGSAPLRLSPLKTGLPDDISMDLIAAMDVEPMNRLVDELMLSAADHPYWDEYLREYRKFIKATGERRERKVPVVIPKFATWANQKTK